LQILRGLKRLILGLGKVPEPPQQLRCAAANRSAVRLSWQPPAEPGHPPFHKYVLQRQQRAGGDGAVGDPAAAEGRWEPAGEPDDEDTAWVDLPPAKGSYRYRLTAWSAFGHSSHAVTDDGSGGSCQVRAVARRPAAPMQLAPAEVQALLAAVAAAGNASAAGGHAHSGGAAPSVAWSLSAASSAAVVALTILLKASQLRVGGVLLALCRWLAARLPWLRGPPATGSTAGEAATSQAQQQAGAGGAPAAAPLQRAGSSRAVLGGGDEAAAVPGSSGALQMGPAAGSSGMLHSSSSLQLLAGAGEASGQMGGTGTELPAGWDEAGLAAARQAAEEQADEEVQQAVQRGARCARPGCHRRFDRLRDMRRRLEVRGRGRHTAALARRRVRQLTSCWWAHQHGLQNLSCGVIDHVDASLPAQSHYCTLCQRVYCLQHTRVSPHGPRGGCGLESQCICHACFAELAPAQQTACERSNRLPKLATTTMDTAASAARVQQDGLPQRGPTSGAEDPGASGGAANGGASPQPGGSAGELSSPNGVQRAPSNSQLSAGAQAGPAAARKRWLKAGAALRAVLPFKAAGSTPSSPI
jgi:hypothetical protein